MSPQHTSTILATCRTRTSHSTVDHQLLSSLLHMMLSFMFVDGIEDEHDCCCVVSCSHSALFSSPPRKGHYRLRLRKMHPQQRAHSWHRRSRRTTRRPSASVPGLRVSRRSRQRGHVSTLRYVDTGSAPLQYPQSGVSLRLALCGPAVAAASLGRGTGRLLRLVWAWRGCVTVLPSGCPSVE